MTTWAVTEEDMRGLSVRLRMLETQHRKPEDFCWVDPNRAAKTLRRWLSRAIPSDDPPPLAVLEALCDDLNTPQGSCRDATPGRARAVRRDAPARSDPRRGPSRRLRHRGRREDSSHRQHSAACVRSDGGQLT